MRTPQHSARISSRRWWRSARTSTASPPANSAYDFALGTARQRGNKRAIRQLEAIGPPPHLDAKQFGTRVRWASNFGGVTHEQTYGAVVRSLLASLVRSSDYSVGDVLRTVRGITAPRPPAARDGDAGSREHRPRLDVPLVMVQGRLDQVAPGEAAQRYFDTLEAPSKELVWFENSAHTPQFEEPEKFRDSSCKFEPICLPNLSSDTGPPRRSMRPDITRSH